jgi:hypothetical protein
MNSLDQGIERTRAEILAWLLGGFFHKMKNKIGVVALNLDVMSMGKRGKDTDFDDAIKDSGVVIREMAVIMGALVYLSELNLSEQSRTDFSRDLRTISPLFENGVIKNSKLEDRSDGTIRLERAMNLRLCLLIVGYAVKLRSFIETGETIHVCFLSGQENLTVDFTFNFRRDITEINLISESDPLRFLLKEINGKVSVINNGGGNAVLTVNMPYRGYGNGI